MKTIGKISTASKFKESVLSDPIGTTNILRGYIHPSDRAITAN